MEFEKQFDWCIEWYDKETEFAVGYERFSGLSLNEAREIFGEKSAFIIGCYSIEHEVSAIQPFVKHQIDLSKYDYAFFL